MLFLQNCNVKISKILGVNSKKLLNLQPNNQQVKKFFGTDYFKKRMKLAVNKTFNMIHACLIGMLSLCILPFNTCQVSHVALSV